jgi:N-acetylneuraminic acid mutarotase
MKRLSCALFALTFLLIVIGIQPLFAQVQGQWASTGTMQSARELNTQVLLSNGKVLSMGGVDNNGNLLASSELYSSSSGKWTLTGSMSTARQVFPAVVLPNKKVLISGGFGASGTVLSAAELYDPTTGAWSSAGSLSVARFAHTATLLQNGKVLVTGGCTASICGPETAVSELYDPTSNSWSITGNLNTARGYHTAVRLKTGMVLAIGGFSGLTSCELYDPTTGTWTNAASTNAGRYLNTATVLSDGKVLVAGGANGRYPVSSAELYDPTANTWTYTGNMTIGRYAHTATLLTDGTVLVPGGVGQPISCGKDCTGYIPTSKVDIYSEVNGTFKASPSLGQPQAYQSTTLLKTGGALQDGGIGTTNICCVVLNTAQIYTPLTLTFSASSLNFGLLQIGQTSPPQTVTVTNVSNHSVKFSSIATSGEFSQSHTCPPTLASGQNCTITVTFTPTVAGTQNSAVTLKDNCPGSPKQTISLTGTGETLALGFTPASLNLGSVAVGSSITQSATLTNDGSAPVNLTGYSVSPADGTFTQTNNCPATLNVQQTCTFQITFKPPDVFTYNATLSVTNSAGAAATLPLTGTGLDGG